jgi:glutathione S-transferase
MRHAQKSSTADNSAKSRLEKSRSQRIVWLLQECKGIDLQIKTYKRQSDMLAPPELKSVHPLGKSPLVTVEVAGQAKPLVLAESAFISEYLTDNFAPHLAPAKYAAGQEPTVGLESESWTRYRFYMHYAEGSLMSLLMVKLFMDRESRLSPSYHNREHNKC